MNVDDFNVNSEIKESTIGQKKLEVKDKFYKSEKFYVLPLKQLFLLH